MNIIKKKQPYIIPQRRNMSIEIYNNHLPNTSLQSLNGNTSYYYYANRKYRYNKTKNWRNGPDEKMGLKMMIDYLNEKSTFSEMIFDEKNNNKNNNSSSNTNLEQMRSLVYHNHIMDILSSSSLSSSSSAAASLSLLNLTLSSSLSLSSSSSSSSSITMNNVKIFSLSSADNILFKSVIKSMKYMFDNNQNDILFLAIIIYLIYKESSSCLSLKDINTIIASPGMNKFLKKIVIILRYKQGKVDTCIIIGKMANVVQDVVGNCYLTNNV
uniref:Uncharacterized protein n=1 Tax=Metapenaeus ensis majanivirus TaxID=2984279 RepID=A0A9C7BZL0_9VIRU|nr:MAG: hypothetical protein [Metapenaeus ensis majanivirus]